MNLSNIQLSLIKILDDALASNKSETKYDNELHKLILESKISTFVKLNLEPELDNYQAEYNQRILFNEILHLEGIRISEILTKNDIKHIFIKGYGIGIKNYSSFLEREISDIDILISPKDIERTLKLFTKNHFARILKLKKSQSKIHQRFQHSIPLRNKNGIEVDLHFKIAETAYNFNVPNQFFFQNSSIYKEKEVNFNLLNNEAELILLIIHSAKHLWNDIRFYIDYSKIINQNLDIKYISKIIRKYNLEKAFQQLNHNNKEIFDKNLELRINPKDKISYINPFNKDMARLSYLKLQLNIRTKIFQKLKLIFYLVFIPNEQDWIKLESNSLLPYFFYKPAKTFINFLKSLRK